MEKEYPSTEETQNSIGIFSRIKSIFHFLNRKSSKVDFDFSSRRIEKESDYVGFKELFDLPIPKEFKDYYEKRFSPKGVPKSENERKFYIERLKIEAAEFYERIGRLPAEDRDFILERLKSNDNNFSHFYPENILNISKRKLFIKNENGDREISVKGLIAVHKTRYIPNDRTIKTTGNAVGYNESDILPIEAARQTIHFTLNHPVNAHEGGNWDDAGYAILLPLENIINDNVVTLSAADTFTLGDVSLENKSAELLISLEAFKKMSKDEIGALKQRTGAEIITVQDEADEHFDDTINRRVKERGYTNFEAGSNGSWEGQNDLIDLAKSLNKKYSMHYWSPFGNIESNISDVLTDSMGRRSDSKHRKDIENNIKNNFREIKEDIRIARGGKTTKKDKRSLAKIKLAGKKLPK